MRPLVLLLLFTLHAFANGGPEPAYPPVVSPQKTMTLFQQKQADAEDGDVGSPCLRFNDGKHPAVALDLGSLSWEGLYLFSPDEHWLLRLQKTGSGENMGMLYRILEDGTVMEILGFDSRLWQASDAVARFKKAQLYHTHLAEAKWSEDHKTLSITLEGTRDDSPKKESESQGESQEVNITYDLENHTFQPVQAPR